PDRSVIVAQFGAGTDHVSGAGHGGQLAAPGDVVVVEMRLDDVRDPDIQIAGRREIDVHIAARVDDCGDAGGLVGDEGGEMTAPLDPELANLHRREPSTGCGWRPRPAVALGP